MKNMEIRGHMLIFIKFEGFFCKMVRNWFAWIYFPYEN
jgi:hypothetical protein